MPPLCSLENHTSLWRSYVGVGRVVGDLCGIEHRGLDELINLVLIEVLGATHLSPEAGWVAVRVIDPFHHSRALSCQRQLYS